MRAPTGTVSTRKGPPDPSDGRKQKKTVCPLDQVCLVRVIDEQEPLDEQKTPSGCRSQDTTKTQAKNALTSALTWTFARTAELAS